MYGYQSTRSGDATKAVLIFVGLLLVGAVITGVVLGNSEMLNPSLHTAKVDNLRAETEALRVRTVYEQRQREIELRQAEEKAAIELQALRDRRAREAKLREWAGIAGLAVGSVVVIALTITASYYYIVAKAKILIQDQATKTIHQARLSSGSEGEERTPPKHGQTSRFVQRSNGKSSHINYRRFLAFCQDRVLSNGHRPLPLDFSVWDGGEGSLHDQFSLNEAQTYMAALERARIIKLGINDHTGWVLDKRINDIGDIKYRISPKAFDKIA